MNMAFIFFYNGKRLYLKLNKTIAKRAYLSEIFKPLALYNVIQESRKTFIKTTIVSNIFMYIRDWS